MDDKELVERVQNGDHAAFEVLVRLHYRAAYNLAFRFMKDHGAADDVVQDSFLKAHKAIQGFRQDAAFKSWLLRITANTAKNALRSKHHKARVDMEEVDMGSTHGDFSAMEREQTSKVLQWAISQLPEKQKVALQLRIFEDMSFKEVAAAMESPFDTAKANFRHALINLRKILKASKDGKAFEEVQQAFESLQEDYDHDR